MKKLSFSININAPKSTVWEILWNDESYRAWTSVFGEGSYAVSNWNEGDKIHFLSTTGSGMYSIIEKMLPQEFMSFKHLGMVENGIEQEPNEKTKDWEGATENYTLKETQDQTELIVEMDMSDSHEQYFKEKFPIALQKVKELSENYNTSEQD
jgi:hypothetical protein